jgi:hypothetical protein
MGARIITGIEYSKRFDNPDTDQRLLYCFLHYGQTLCYISRASRIVANTLIYSCCP